MWILIEQTGHDKAEIRKTERLMEAKRNEKDLLIGEACGRVCFWHKHQKYSIHFKPFIQCLIRIKYLAPRPMPSSLLIHKAISIFYLFWGGANIKMSEYPTRADFVGEKYNVKDLFCQRVIETDSSNPVLNLRWSADYDAWLDSFLIPQIYCFKSTALSHDSIIQSILQGLAFCCKIFDDMRTLRDPFILIWGKQLYLIPNVCRGQGSYITPAGPRANVW